MKSAYIFLTILSVSYYAECTSNPSENVKFVTKLEQKTSSDWESDVLEPEVIQNEKSYITTPQVHEDRENEQDVKNKETVYRNEEKEISEFDLEDIKVGSNKRVVRQANTGYSSIYPTLTPQNPMYPTPYRPGTGAQGNYPNNYNQNNYNNPSQSHYYQNSTIPSNYPRPPPQNPFLNNTSYSNQGYYNQGSINNHNQSYTNPYNNKPYPQYPNSNQYNNYPSANSSYPPYHGNFQQYGNNVPTPANQWSQGYNNSRNYPSQGVTYSTPRNVLNPAYPTPSPSNRYPPYNSPNPSQQYPRYNNTQSQNNYNRSNQWSSGAQNQYPGGNYPAYTPTDGRSTNYSRPNYPTNYPAYNPSPYPTQRPYSPSGPNSYYPYAPNANSYNNQYNKEPDHFFYAPANKDPRNPYDPGNNPSHNFSYSQ